MMKFILLLLAVSVLLSSAQIDDDEESYGSFRKEMKPQPIPLGGLSRERPATSAIDRLVKRFEKQVRSTLNTPMTQFKAVSFCSQVVAGTNYFIKVYVGENQFIILRIYKRFDGLSSLSGIEAGKSKFDPIEYFAPNLYEGEIPSDSC